MEVLAQEKVVIQQVVTELLDKDMLEALVLQVVDITAVEAEVALAQ
jgi:hypothetical protein